ncbi:hypothetical protein CXB51_025223 [Gossypium anomalum]|uniref:Reverse transcriptase Ty1/copia-type domain-containing protein n=1 Tax=Gossypium anomalum TaxID=47600 RepID=A0A8J6CQ98_9ROSI|nr:hypothetical protein CXB51_025223 [Gossypium anomalum]
MDYWGYAFCSVVHLINHLPTPIQKGQSPYQDHLRATIWIFILNHLHSWGIVPNIKNTHTMITRSKVGIFKPKALSAEEIDYEPRTIEEALTDLEWRVIGCKWLFKVKKNPDGTIARRNARLVAKGCSQVNVNNAFLNGDLTDKVFMQQPLGYAQFGPTDKEFSLKDIGDLHYFLGIKVTRSSIGSLHLCQCKYIRDLLDRSSLTNAKSVHTPMNSLSVLSKDEGDRLADPTEYRSLAGALQYMVLTRLDIAYAANRVCQFMHAPSLVHLVALKRILRYLRGTIDYGLIFRPSDKLSLIGYADANWGLDFDDR